ncbi:ankyrin repeat domain-containing protein [Ottowia thiooxydans]|uniref:ankyrin repeat domain-containing protein n=1 Tax=Ottowia thiooxydans TaxID=219182 RepID=UPI00040372B5|nr:ankyrin repeat domain-containing protein [Ottowia thiooxydans]
MAKAKKKLLPKDFTTQLEAGDLDALKAVFDSCDVNARGGIFKQSALAFNECPDELVRWLVTQGADLSTPDSYGQTPLHARAGHWQGRIEVLLELGADVHSGENVRGTPLHMAAGIGNIHTARLLLNHGARVAALDGQGLTPLVYALQRCSNAGIEGMAAMAELLLEAAQAQAPKSARTFVDRIFKRRLEHPTPVTPEMKAHVQRIGTEFEFHRAGFNPDSVDATSVALEKLYALFDVPPVPRRTTHDGKSPIIANATRWQDQHQELWELLVPSKGAADTVQGEVVRISGRIRSELEGNGGVNWDASFKKMADAFLAHVASGVALPESALAEAREIVSEVKGQRGDTERLCALAVEWVGLNPKPEKLSTPSYHR